MADKESNNGEEYPAEEGGEEAARKGDPVPADEAPQQPQMHEEELISTAPVPVEEAAAEADVPLPPDKTPDADEVEEAEKANEAQAAQDESA